MSNLRRTRRVQFEQDVLVECRIEGVGGVHLGMIRNASYQGLFCEVPHFVDVHQGDQVAVRFARDGLNAGLGIAGMTTSGRIVRVSRSPRGVSFGVEIPDLRARVRTDLSNFLARYQQAA